MTGQPQSKKTLATEAPGKKAEKKNQQRAGGVFSSLRKMLDLMMEILPSILGDSGRPSKDNRAFFIAVFHLSA